MASPSGRVGEISKDRSAVIGRDGWCFIYQGSNNYRDAYHDSALISMGDKWARLIERRQRVCDEWEIPFVQLIIPNKATLMPERFPESLGKGLTSMLQGLLAAKPNACLLCPINEMRHPKVKDHVFRRNDSHLTIGGSCLLTESILDTAKINLGSVPYIETKYVDHTGDLGGKFVQPLSERFCAPKFDEGLLNLGKAKKISEKNVSGFNGTRQSFYNPDAPLEHTVLVFGNSFFERVPSWGISPLFCALFKHFHFIWGADLKKKLIERINPNLIIAQTCERFMTAEPIDKIE
jgi:hypothetical protein